MPECLRFKKSNCKNCYKCIRYCPVKSIKFTGEQANIVNNECILCGQCFVVCPQNAKEIKSELEKLIPMQKNDVSQAPQNELNNTGNQIIPTEMQTAQNGNMGQIQPSLENDVKFEETKNPKVQPPKVY